MAPLYPHIPDCHGKIVLVLGLGKTGKPTVAALRASGADVWAWDDSAKARGVLSKEATLKSPEARDWSKIAYLVLSPGIPYTHPAPHPLVAAAQQANVPILSDIELLYRACPNAFYIGVTGTNGKSTVTSLIGHILKQAGRQVAIGGNLGQAALTLPPLAEDGIYVLELSSYQLDITPSALADIAILLNITPDHLDRHGNFANYAEAKARLFRTKNKDSIGIVGLDDAPSRQLFDRFATNGGRKMIGISGTQRVPAGVGVEAGILIDGLTGKRIDLRKIDTLPGTHNWQNAAAAYAACLKVNIQPDIIEAGFFSYPGLAHRQEKIATIGQVQYVNDSKATNADATAKALACYENIYWLAGGRSKEGGLSGLDEFLPCIRKVYLFGEAEQAFTEQLRGKSSTVSCATLDRAFSQAHEDAQRAGSGTVLLSPACASWDQYANFEERGEHFRQLVQRAVAQSGQKKGAA